MRFGSKAVAKLLTERAILSLGAIQNAFASGILSVDVQTPILSALNAGQLEPADRLSIYRGNLRAIWRSALSGAYPVLLQLLGEDFFDFLARDYGRLYPSQSGDLNRFGARFPEFLQATAALSDYPYCPDVAELEWRVHVAYYARDCAPLNLGRLLQEQGASVQECRLQLHPSASLFNSSFAAVNIWHAHQQEEVANLNVPLTQASRAVIIRPEWQVQVISLDQAAYAALQAIERGDSLGHALEKALACDAQFDVGSELASWFRAGIFSSYSR